MRIIIEVKKLLISATLLTSYVYLNAQNTSADTLKTQTLPELTIQAKRTLQDIYRLEPVKGTFIYSGKKTEVIDLTHRDVTLSEKYGRQLFSKIPGVFVYDMDGTGNQVNISTRGLDPHRGWEFNIRKDGVLTNSDMYGYPASHYNIPMEAVERIELVRGTGSLQYGAQFGGLLNYISKQPDTATALRFENINTVGSYGLVSTYNSASGKIGKFRYSTWMNKKQITGYRNNSNSQYDAEAVTLLYDFNKNLTIKAEWTHSNYSTHLPGPLTDSMFYADPQMATRSRNYYNPTIHVPSVSLFWNISPNTKMEIISSAVIGARNSVLFDKPATIPDTINFATGEYANRQVDIDNFNSYTQELRVLHNYSFLRNRNNLTAGIQYMNNDLHRRQLGTGTTGSDFDLTLTTPDWGRNLHFTSENIAVYAENRWVLSSRFSLNTGFRIEAGESHMSGLIIYYPDSTLPNTITHTFPLFGVSAQYDINTFTNVYAGWSQAYRPVIFKDIIPASVYEVADKDLEDAFGYNAEAGIRGSWHFLKWDITGFYLQYNNRMGSIAQSDTAGNLIIYRTNIGNSHTKGLELFLQGDFDLGRKASISVFTSTSYMDARYEEATIRSGNENINIEGNAVESVPDWISRNGCTLRYANCSLSALYSYTSASYADALNTVEPNASGSAGLVPAYSLIDVHVGIKLNNKMKLQLNGNNILDEQYFTKRPQFYPGPGIWPSDGRTLSATVFIKI